MSNIRRLLLVLALLAPAASAQYFPYNGQCSKGGQEVLVQNQPSKGTVPIGGTVRSLTSGVIGSYPGCTVTVFLTGTQTPATIFSDNHGTVLANPFTANTDGSYLLFSTQGGYDIAMSGAGLPATVTLTGIQLGGGGSGPPGSLSVSTNGVTNGSQTLLNFANGANMSIVDNGQGTDTFSVVGVITGATSNSGLIQTGSTLGLYPCPNGQILKSIGTNWACSAFLSGPVIQTNGTNNVVQTLLNLQPGSGITITDNGSGTDTFTASGSGFTGSGTPNFLTKFTSPFGLGNSAISEASPTSPAIDPNGYDAGTTGAFSNDIANSALGGGTVVNALACNDGTGKEEVCQAASSTTNLPDGTCIGNCGTTGNGIIAYLGIILIGFDNQSVPGDWAVESTTLNGYLHDTGLTSQTPGQPNFYVWSANAGPNTAGQYRRLTPSEIAAAATSISFTVNGGAPLGSPVNCVNGIGTTCLNASGNNFEVDVAAIQQAVTVTTDPTPTTANNGEFYQLNPSGAINFTLPASIPTAQWNVVASNISAFTVTIQGNGNNICSLTCASTLSLPSHTQYYIASASGAYVASIQGAAGSVTSIATTSPITGGTITSTGTIACATCAIGPGSSTANHIAEFSGTDGVTLKDGGVAPSVYALQVAGSGLSAGDTVNFNATTPVAPSNGYNVTFATSKAGSTDSVSAALVGDGTSTHFLNGTGVFSTPAGGGGGNCNGGAAQCVYLKNNASGTTNGLVSKWVSQSADAGNVGTTTVGDGTVGNSVPVAGIVVSGGGTTGFAQVAISGTVPCTFDGTTETQGDQVYLSTTAGKCHDPGAASTPANENPNIHYQIGIVDATVTGNATANVDLTPASLFGGISGFVANANYFTFMGANSYAGMQFQPMNLQQIGSTGLAASDLSITAAGGNVGLRFADGNNGNQFTRLVGCGNPVCGAANNDFMIDMLTGNSGNSPSLRVNGGFYVVQKTETFGGAGSLDASKGVQHSITLTGNSTISGMTNQNPAQEVMALICQNGTGGFTLTWGASFINPPAMPAPANACMATDWFYDGTNYDFIGSPRPITVVKTAQASSIGTTTITTPQAAGMYKVTATLDCATSVSTATATGTINWTDPSSTAQSATIPLVTCTTLGSSSISTLITAFRVKANTSITYATTAANTPSYDLSIALETMTQ